ncbi:MAG: tetratricopeptide repeat protein, partial [Myxococcales bacterium]|nr:tetratricopeptide repeat protein [Myxococcales bacterium]
AGGDPLGGGLDLGSPAGGDPLGGGLDLGSPAGGDPLGGGLDLGSPAGGDPLGGGLDLGGQGAGDPLGGGLDLGSSGADDPLGGGLDALDLESPSAGGGMGLDLPESQSVAQSGDVVSFSKPSGKAPPPKQTRLSKKIASNDDSLDLDDAPLEGPAIKAKPAVGGEATEQATGAKRASRSANKKSAKFQKIGAAVLGVAILGVGGYLGSQLIADEKQKEEVVGKQGSSAQKHLTSDDPGHWQEAIVAAKQMQEADAKSVEAVAIQAEAHYAAALDRGTGVENHQKQAVTAIRSMRKLSGKSSHSALAEGLHALTNSQYDEAIKTLSSAAKKNKKNPNAPLYLGWAQAQKGDYTKAVIAFDACLALSPKRIPALYAKAEALLNAGKHDEAKESFLEVTAVDKDHLGALLGIARLATVSDFGGRENRYTELLGRPDIAKQDPRTVSKATSLAADEARKAGRLAVASERYTEALKVDPGNLEAVVGQAAISVAKDNIDDAAERLDRVLALTPTHSAATMLLIEVSMMQGDHEKAATSLANLIGREPPIEHEPTLARMELLRGRLLGADLQPMLAKLKDLEASITPAKGGESDAGASPELLALRTEVESAIKSVEKAFQESIKLEGGGGVSATLQLASFYAQVGRADEGVAVLVPLREQSKSDASLAVSLGVAYMAVKNHTEAIVLFRDALRQKPTDTEARFQLGRALAEDKQPDEAITELKTAYEGSEKREDIGLELAEIYHNLGRSKDAVELYKSVLEGPAPSLNAKAKAGRYFVRVEEYDKAAAIGEALLKENPRDPAGLFLTGEKLFQDEKYSKARDKFAKASKADPVGQYFDALGRANQAMQSLSKAMRAFERAIQVEPSYLDPYIGLASVRVARREYFVALETLAKAVKVEPENALIHYLIGQCHLEMRDIDTAVSSFERAAQYDPHPGMAYFGLGQAHDANGKPKDAAAAFDKATKLEMERVAESPSAKEGPWVSEAYRKLGYAIRESSGSRKAQYEAWLSYRERVEIESDASEEVDKLLIPLSNKYK